jgi:sigma-B regulation protein RsbQ
VVEIGEALGVKDGVFVGHSVAAMIGILAQRMRPGMFGHLVLVGPSPYYLNDGEYRGGFTRADIEGLLEAMASNYLGWSSDMAPAIV